MGMRRDIEVMLLPPLAACELHRPYCIQGGFAIGSGKQGQFSVLAFHTFAWPHTPVSSLPHRSIAVEKQQRHGSRTLFPRALCAS